VEAKKDLEESHCTNKQLSRSLEEDRKANTQLKARFEEAVSNNQAYKNEIAALQSELRTEKDKHLKERTELQNRMQGALTMVTCALLAITVAIALLAFSQKESALRVELENFERRQQDIVQRAR